MTGGKVVDMTSHLEIHPKFTVAADPLLEANWPFEFALDIDGIHNTPEEPLPKLRKLATDEWVSYGQCTTSCHLTRLSIDGDVSSVGAEVVLLPGNYFESIKDVIGTNFRHDYELARACLRPGPNLPGPHL